MLYFYFKFLLLIMVCFRGELLEVRENFDIASHIPSKQAKLQPLFLTHYFSSRVCAKTHMRAHKFFAQTHENLLS